MAEKNENPTEAEGEHTKQQEEAEKLAYGLELIEWVRMFERKKEIDPIGIKEVANKAKLDQDQYKRLEIIKKQLELVIGQLNEEREKFFVLATRFNVERKKPGGEKMTKQHKLIKEIMLTLERLDILKAQYKAEIENYKILIGENKSSESSEKKVRRHEVEENHVEKIITKDEEREIGNIESKKRNTIEKQISEILNRAIEAAKIADKAREAAQAAADSAEKAAGEVKEKDERIIDISTPQIYGISVNLRNLWKWFSSMFKK